MILISESISALVAGTCRKKKRDRVNPFDCIAEELSSYFLAGSITCSLFLQSLASVPSSSVVELAIDESKKIAIKLKR